MEIRFTVIGTPAPQGSKSAFVRGGKAVVVDGSSASGRAKHASWRADVALYATRARGPEFEQFTGPVYVSLRFRLARPASDPYRTLHSTKPDLDKLVRSVLDALTESALLVDDSQVQSLMASKVYARGDEATGVDVTVEDYTWIETSDRASAKREAAEVRKGSRPARTR